jgi:hypothetical protein
MCGQISQRLCTRGHIQFLELAAAPQLSHSFQDQSRADGSQILEDPQAHRVEPKLVFFLSGSHAPEANHSRQHQCSQTDPGNRMKESTRAKNQD